MFPTDHPSRSAVLSNLANAKFINCQVNDRHIELDVVIKMYQDVLQLRPGDHPDHYVTAFDLGLALLARFQRRGDDSETDRVEETKLLRRVVEVCPVASYARRSGHLALQMAGVSTANSRTYTGLGNHWYHIRTQNLPPRVPEGDDDCGGNGYDARYALHLCRERLRPYPPHTTVRFTRGFVTEVTRCVTKPNLSSQNPHQASDRFEDNGELADIYHAISMLEDVIRLTLEINGRGGSPSYP
jgi:hypothetical protein